MPEICWFHQICLFWKSHRNPVLKMLLISIGSSKTNMALLHARQDNKADKSASNSLNPSIFEGLVTLCAPDAVCFSRHIPHASGRILAEGFLFDRKFIAISYQIKKRTAIRLPAIQSTYLLSKKSGFRSQVRIRLFRHENILLRQYYPHLQVLLLLPDNNWKKSYHYLIPVQVFRFLPE